MQLTTIECVAKGDDYIPKNKFPCEVDSDTWKSAESVIKLRLTGKAVILWLIEIDSKVSKA